MSHEPPRHPGERASAAASDPDDDLDSFVPPDFEPAYPRVRWDGWTPKRQADFIQALAETACVDEACRTVGMSARSAYALRARFDAVSFRNAWDAALDYAIRRLSDAVMSRAINGVAVPIFYQGQQIGEKRRYNDRLAMFLLRYRDPLRYGRWVDSMQHRGHPEGDAFELAEARRAVREDAGLAPTDVPERTAQRVDEIAAQVERMERVLRLWDIWEDPAKDQDVPRTS